MTVLDQIHGHTKRFFVQDDLGKSHGSRIGPARMRARNQRRALLLLGGPEIWTIEGREVRMHVPFGGVAGASEAGPHQEHVAESVSGRVRIGGGLRPIALGLGIDVRLRGARRQVDSMSEHCAIGRILVTGAKKRARWKGRCALWATPEAAVTHRQSR